MKHIMKGMAFAGLLAVAVAACKKDTSNQPKLNLANATETLTASSTAAIVLDSANAQSNVITMSWDSVNFGYKTSTVTYTLQFDVPSDNFTTPQSISVTGWSTPLTGQQINVIANTLALINGSNDTLDVRMKVVDVQSGTGSGSDVIAPVYSNTIPLIVNPYYIPVPLTFLWVPGAYQNWAPATAPQLASSNSINYEGFVMITAANAPSLAFKVTTAADWSHVNMGDNSALATTGNVSTGTLSASGGNIQAPAAGYYFLQENLSDSAFTATLINSWAVSGSAVGSTPVTLTTFDSTKLIWSATNVSLSAGTFQFVGNAGSSNLTFGQGTQDSYHIKQNAKTAITVTTAGVYDIKLVLNSPLNYTDTLIKH
jgi:hypothetical protein